MHDTVPAHTVLYRCAGYRTGAHGTVPEHATPSHHPRPLDPFPFAAILISLP